MDEVLAEALESIPADTSRRGGEPELRKEDSEGPRAGESQPGIN